MFGIVSEEMISEITQQITEGYTGIHRILRLKQATFLTISKQNLEEIAQTALYFAREDNYPSLYEECFKDFTKAGYNVKFDASRNYNSNHLINKHFNS